MKLFATILLCCYVKSSNCFVLLQFDDVPLMLEVEPNMVDRENAFGYGVN